MGFDAKETKVNMTEWNSHIGSIPAIYSVVKKTETLN